MLAGILACELLKKTPDAGDPDAAAVTTVVADTGASPPPPPAALAVNEGDIARFPDEQKLDNVPATVQRFYNVRDAPPAGKIVGTVTKGATVAQIAKRGWYFLILFDAPAGKTMGWVNAEAFSAIVDAGIPEPKCVAPEVALISDTGFCGRVCDKDADCPSGQACKGTANKWKAGGKAGDGVQVCTVFAPHPVDAGHPLVVVVIDSGPPTAIDAGKPVLPAPTSDIVAPTAGQCPPLYVTVSKDGQCHRSCPKPSDCRAGFRCGVCDGRPTCNNGPNFCPK